LSGVGLCLMTTLRDPLRDSLAFENFAQGAGLGCVALLVASQIEYRRITGGFNNSFLLAAFLLSAALIVFGTGPQGSDARIRLL